MTQIQLRRDTAANWAAANPVLGAGELGLDTTNLIWKIGDGSTAWSALTVALATVAATQTLTSKSMSGTANTFTNIPPSAVSSPFFTPSDHGLLAWTYDPVSGTTSSLVTGGVANTALIKVPVGITITNIVSMIGTAPGTLTNAFVALYSFTGTLLSQSANLTASWNTAGIKSNALATPQAVAAGTYRIVFWATVSSGALPGFIRAGGQDVNNVGTSSGFLTGNAIRYGTANTGLTTTAPSTLGALSVAFAGAWWFGLS